MRSARGKNVQLTTQYFVLPATDHPPEIARVKDRSLAAYFEPVTGTWINDPLLAAEVLTGDEWRPAQQHELPEGVALPPEEPPTRTGRGRRRRRRQLQGRHADPGGS